MTTELSILFFATILGLAQLLLATHFATLQRGLKWNMSNRDVKLPELTGAALRTDRAFKNFLETFPFFAVAILLVHLSGRTSTMSALGAQIYFAARVIYVPVYGFGIPGVRSAIWGISMIGLLLVFAALL